MLPNGVFYHLQIRLRLGVARTARSRVPVVIGRNMMYQMRMENIIRGDTVEMGQPSLLISIKQ